MAINLNITVADQPNTGGGGGPVDPPPGGGSGTTVTTTASWQGVTFTLSQACTVGYLADGKPFFVYPGSATTVTWSPAETTAGGLVVNGGMKNPDRGLYQGWDARDNSYLLASKASAPVSMAAGDSLVVEIHNPDPSVPIANRTIYALAYSAILCVTATPAAHSYIPAVGPYSAGGTARPVYVFDVTTITFPSYTISSAVESMATVLGRMERYNPTLSNPRGVENRRKMGPAGFTAQDSYGRDIAIAMAHAGVRLIGNDSTADKQTLARHMMMHFAESYPAIKANGSKRGADGGQTQGMIMPIILALGWLGDTAGLSTLPADIGGNELRQAFRVDATLLDKIRNPHNNVGDNWPQTTLRRTITNVSGNVITFSDSASWLDVFVNTDLVRESDSARARVIAYNPAAKTMTIDAQPGSPFVNGNVCFNRSTYAQSVGDAEWTLKGLEQLSYYTPAREGHGYRTLNEWDGQLMCIHAFGFLHSSWDYFKDYVVRANSFTNPPAPDTYPDHFSSTGVRDFWNTHWATISGVTQTVG